jgi:hypothetical protein
MVLLLSTASLAGQPSVKPSDTLNDHWTLVNKTHHDVLDLASVMDTKGIEVEFARLLIAVASDHNEMCYDLVEELKIYELLPPTLPERRGVAVYINGRVQHYGPKIDDGIKSATYVLSTTKLPGLAQLASRVKEQLQKSKELFPAVAPK